MIDMTEHTSVSWRRQVCALTGDDWHCRWLSALGHAALRELPQPTGAR